jgi:hypothetical protein
MHDVRYDDEQDWLNVESVVGLGRPLWTTRFQDRRIVFLQKFALLKLLKQTKFESDHNYKPSHRQNMAVLLCRLGLFLSPVASISSSLVADHMATVYACDQKREAMLVSYYSEPILAFGATMQWNKYGLRPLLKSLRTALIRGIVSEGTLGEISAMILLLKSMDELDVGLEWSSVLDFLGKLVVVNKDFKEELGGLIPKGSQLNFNHFVQWFGKFNPGDICQLLRRRAACILQRNQDGADLLIPFFYNDGEDVKFGAILIQVKNCLQTSDVKDVGRKLFASFVFKHWEEEQQNIPLFRLVLELGLSRGKKSPKAFPVKDKADLIEVSVTRDRTVPEEKKGDAVFVVRSSSSDQYQSFSVSQKNSDTVEEGKIELLRLRGIAGIPWMNEPTFNAFTDLLEGPLTPKTLSSFTEGFSDECRWNNHVILPGLEKEGANK